MVKGYVYCLSNPSFGANIYKIGFTVKCPYRRANELYQTGLPTPFKIEFSKKVSNPREIEQQFHCMFRRQRINCDREFFEIPLTKIRQQFQKTKGTWWKNPKKPHEIEKPVAVTHTCESWSLKQRRLRRKCKSTSFKE